MASTKKRSGAKEKKTATKKHGAGGDVVARRAAASNNPDERAFRKMLAQLAALPVEQLLIPRFDVFDAAVAGQRLAGHAQGYRAQLKILDQAQPGTLRSLELLDESACALRYIRTRLDETQGVEDSVTVPPEVVATADDLRVRMDAVLRYNFPRDGELIAALDVIRQGQGHQDRANDLRALARHYEALADVLARKDHSQYDAADAQLAHDTAAKIQKCIITGKVARSAEWSDLQARANAIMMDAYDTIRRAMIFLDGKGASDKYPSLYAAVRAMSGRSSSRTANQEEAPTNGTPTPAPGSDAHPS